MTVTEVVPGLTRESVQQISASKNEPGWMLERRLAAWQIFDSLPMPSRQDEQWRRTDIGKLKLDLLTPYTEADVGVVESPLQLGGPERGSGHASQLRDGQSFAGRRGGDPGSESSRISTRHCGNTPNSSGSTS